MSLYQIMKSNALEAKRLTGKPAQTSASWYKGDAPTANEALAEIYRISRTDPDAANNLYEAFSAERDMPSSPFYNPHTKATNDSALKIISSYGIDTSGGAKKVLDDNAWLLNYATYSPTTGAITQGKSKESKAAYWYAQINDAESLTQSAEQEWAALQDEIAYWASRDDKNLTDEEILQRIDFSKYKTLAKLDESKANASPELLNRPIGYSRDNLYGAIWAARNGRSTGNPEIDSIYYTIGEGNSYKPNLGVRNYLDASKPTYDPYRVGSTMDSETYQFRTSGFDDKWLQENAGLRADEKYKTEYERIYNAEQNTKAIEQEIKGGYTIKDDGIDTIVPSVQEYINTLSTNAFWGRITYDNVLADFKKKYPGVYDLASGIPAGNIYNTTRKIDFDFAGLFAKLKNKVDVLNARKNAPTSPDARDTASKAEADANINATGTATVPPEDTAPKSKTGGENLWDMIWNGLTNWMAPGFKDVVEGLTGTDTDKIGVEPEDGASVKPLDKGMRMAGGGASDMGQGKEYQTDAEKLAAYNPKVKYSIDDLHAMLRAAQDEYARGKAYYDRTSDYTDRDIAAKKVTALKAELSKAIVDEYKDIKVPKDYQFKNVDRSVFMQLGMLSVMTDYEIDKFKYILSERGEEKALEYYDALTETTLNSRYRAFTEVKAMIAGKTGPVGSSILDVAASFARGAQGFFNILDSVFGGEIEPDDPKFAAVWYSDKMKESVMENMSPFEKFVYSTGMSIGENLVGRALLGPYAMLSMSGSAANSAYSNALDRGVSKDNALAYASIVGGLEAGTEYLEFNYFANILEKGGRKGVKGFFAGLAQSMLQEGSEEVASEIGGFLADAVFAKDKAQILDTYAVNLKAANGDEKKAWAETVKSFLSDVLMAGAGGAVSGGFFELVGRAGHRIKSDIIKSAQVEGSANTRHATRESRVETKPVATPQEVLAEVVQSTQAAPNTQESALRQEIQTELQHIRDLKNAEGEMDEQARLAELDAAVQRNQERLVRLQGMRQSKQAGSQAQRENESEMAAQSRVAQQSTRAASQSGTEQEQAAGREYTQEAQRLGAVESDARVAQAKSESESRMAEHNEQASAEETAADAQPAQQEEIALDTKVRATFNIDSGAFGRLFTFVEGSTKTTKSDVQTVSGIAKVISAISPSAAERIIKSYIESNPSLADAQTAAKVLLFAKAMNPKADLASADALVKAALVDRTSALITAEPVQTGVPEVDAAAVALITAGRKALAQTLERWGAQGLLYVGKLAESGNRVLHGIAAVMQAMDPSSKTVIVAQEQSKTMTPLTPAQEQAQIDAFNADMANPVIVSDMVKRAQNQAIRIREAELMSEGAADNINEAKAAAAEAYQKSITEKAKAAAAEERLRMADAALEQAQQATGAIVEQITNNVPVDPKALESATAAESDAMQAQLKAKQDADKAKTDAATAAEEVSKAETAARAKEEAARAQARAQAEQEVRQRAAEALQKQNEEAAKAAETERLAKEAEDAEERESIQNEPEFASEQAPDTDADIASEVEAVFADRTDTEKAAVARKIKARLAEELQLQTDKRSGSVPDNADFIKKVSKKYRVTFQYDTNMKIDEEARVEGRTIYINPNASVGTAVKGVVMHEITHPAEQSEGYKAYSDSALKIKYKGDAEQLAKDVQAKIARYARNGITLTEQEAQNEIVAQITREVIFADEESMARFAQEDPGFIRQVLQHLKDTWESLKSMFSDSDMADIIKARRMLEKALGDTTVSAEKFSLKEQDAAYLQAVESGDMETAQKMVDEAAKTAMLNSKIRDVDGKLIAVYHGTDANFNVFDRNKSRANMDIQGNFFTPWKEDAEGYGRNVRKLYLNITNPATESIGYKALRQFQGQNNAGVKARDYLIRLGYDGVDNSGEEYIMFDSAQAKSADPVTYSDTGSVIPLSERFNVQSNDIRYSLKETDSEGNALSDQQAEYFKDSKVRDKDGKLQKVYHGSGADFNEFSYKFMSSNGSGEGQGFYFTTDKEQAKGYQHDGGQLFEGYLDMKRPLSGSKKTLTRGEVKKLITAIDQTGDDLIINYAEDSRGYPSRAWYMSGLNKAVDAIYSHDETDSEILADIANSGPGTKKVVQTTRKVLGYDGYMVTDKYPGTNVFVAFESNQFKKADNLNPTGSPDIRYSLTPDDDAEIEAVVQRLLTKYGAIKRGETPVDTTRIPKQSGPNAPVNKFVRTVSESGILTDAERKEVNKAIVNGDLSHDIISDKSSIGKADNLIANNGIDAAQTEWNNAIARDGIPNKDQIAIGERLLQKYAKDGNADAVVRMTAELSEALVRAGQSVQASSMLKKMTGAGQLYYLNKAVERINRGIKGKGIVLDEKLVQDLLNAKTPEALDAVVKALQKNAGEQIPPTWKTRLNAWRYFAMLGNPRTHIRNIIGNTIFIPAVKLKNIIGAGIEAATGQERTKSVFALGEYRDFAKADRVKIQDILYGGGKYNESDDITKFARSFGKSIFGNTFQGLSNLNSAALEKEDYLFLNYHYDAALAGYLKAQNVDLKNIDKKLLVKARQYAIDEAKKATYRDASSFATWLNEKSKQGGLTGIVIEGVMPFKKTPANILKRGVEYSPVGLLDTIVRGTVQLRRGDITPAQYIDKFASGLSGTAIAALGMFLSSIGALSIGFNNKDKEDQFKALTGEQPYSVKLNIFGKIISITLDWAVPDAIPLFVGAAIQQLSEEEGGFSLVNILNALSKLTEPIFKLTMLDGINNAIRNASYGGGEPITNILQGAVASFFGQFVPTFAGQVARTIDSTRRRVYTNKTSELGSTFEYLMESVQNKLPGASMQNEQYLNVWGEADKQDSIWLRAFENMFSPAYINIVDVDSVEQVLQEVYKQTKDPNVLPSTASKYYFINNKRIDLTSEQYTTLVKERGTIAHNTLQTLFSDKRFTELSSEQKALAIADAYEYATQLGKSKTTPEYKTSAWVDNALKDGNIVNVLFMKRHDKDVTDYRDTYKGKMFDAIANEDYESFGLCVEAMLLSYHEENPELTKKEAIAYIRNSISDRYKADYIRAYKANDTAATAVIEDLLFSLDIGYSYETFYKWVN